MSYSDPSIEDALDAMLAKEVTDLTIVPMYPQYSGTTVGSVFDSVMNYFKGSDKLLLRALFVLIMIIPIIFSTLPKKSKTS